MNVCLGTDCRISVREPTSFCTPHWNMLDAVDKDKMNKVYRKMLKCLHSELNTVREELRQAQFDAALNLAQKSLPRSDFTRSGNMKEN